MLEDWRKNINRKDRVVYTRRKDFKQLELLKMILGWQVATSSFVKRFKTKAAGMKFAIAFMRKH